MTLSTKDHAERAIASMNAHPYASLDYHAGRDLEHRIRELEEQARLREIDYANAEARANDLEGLLVELREDLVWGTAHYVREPGQRQKDAEFTLIGKERLRQMEELLGPAPLEIKENR